MSVLRSPLQLADSESARTMARDALLGSFGGQSSGPFRGRAVQAPNACSSCALSAGRNAR
eukprot:8080153-Alexandrium_andersonii.AAC.1